MTNRALIVAIDQQLHALADPERAIKQQAYMKSAIPYYGVAMPDVRRIARSCHKDNPLGSEEDFESTIRSMWDDVTHREQWYAALTVATAKATKPFRTVDRLPMYKHLIVTGAWWDVVDDAASHLVGPLVSTDRGIVKPLMQEWAVDDDMWLRRTAIICQLGAKADTDVDLLAAAIEQNIDSKEFFLRKAIGWALREYSRTDPSWVNSYVNAHRERLSALSIREATKHL